MKICRRCQQNPATKGEYCDRCNKEILAEKLEADVAFNSEKELEKERRRRKIKNLNMHRIPE